MISIISSISRIGRQQLKNTPLVTNWTATMSSHKYSTLSVTEPAEFVFRVDMNRPEKYNALNKTMWHEFVECFNELSEKPECRVVLLSGAGKAFCAGIDLYDTMSIFQKFTEQEDVARRYKAVETVLRKFQKSFSAIQNCKKPVIAAIHGPCVGAGVDMISATDIRYCSEDAWFQIKEIDLGMAADVGTLQRLPKIIGSESLVRELAYTGRKMFAAEALQRGLVNEILKDQQSLIEKALTVAKEIASKSPVAVQGTKLSLNFSRDHTIDEGLDHIAMYNQVMLQSEDFINAASALATKGDPPVFAKL